MTTTQPPIHRQTLLALCGVLCALTAGAQDFGLDWHTLDGGGGASTGGVYAVTGTLGQPDAGKSSGGGFTLEGGFWSGVSAAPSVSAPRLFIQSSGGFVTLSWSPATPGFVLQMSDSLSPSAWFNAPSGALNPVRVPIAGPRSFYRLATP